jgi:hypothetical protein
MVDEQNLSLERRSGRDRRRLYDIHYVSDGERMKQDLKERRSRSERRTGWKRVSQWGSVVSES